jgi:hypothetical protein
MVTRIMGYTEQITFLFLLKMAGKRVRVILDRIRFRRSNHERRGSETVMPRNTGRRANSKQLEGSAET